MAQQARDLNAAQLLTSLTAAAASVEPTQPKDQEDQEKTVLKQCFGSSETQEWLSFVQRFCHDDQEPIDETDWLQLSRLLCHVRRFLHQHPETSFKEFRTRQLVKALCERGFGVPSCNLQEMATTGLVVDVLPGNGRRDQLQTPEEENSKEHQKPPVLAFRADMDALPIHEMNSHLSYCSQVQGANPAAHMCGHDGHTTMVLGLCALVVRKANLIPPKSFVRFLFQPAEEGPGGAAQMIAEGALHGVDRVVGLHNYPFPLETIRVQSGPVMAHETEFWIDICGTGGHGSTPQNCMDPILVGSHVVLALQSIVSRNLSQVTSPSVVSVTTFHAGDTHNVISDTAHLAGTIRCFDMQVAKVIQERMIQIVHGTCEAFGAKGHVKLEVGYPPVVNDPEVTSLVVQACEAMRIDLTNADEGLPLMAAEDFSYYLQHRKGCFFFLGTMQTNGNQHDKKGAVSRQLHSNHFDFNDAAIPIGIKAFVGVLQTSLAPGDRANDTMTQSFYSVKDMEAFSQAMERVLQH